jgi:hypothetical protein
MSLQIYKGMNQNINTEEVSPKLMIKRLEHFAKARIGSLSALALDMGKSAGYFAAYKSGNRMIGGKVLIELKRKYSLNPEYLKHGARPILLNEMFEAQNLVSENLIVRKRDIMSYRLLNKNSYPEEEWQAICKDIGLDSSLKEIYEVKDIYSDTVMQMSGVQFHARFEKIRS